MKRKDIIDGPHLSRAFFEGIAYGAIVMALLLIGYAIWTVL